MPDSLPPPAAWEGTRLAALVPLASELCDLKRVRDARSPDSLATRSFRRCWAALAAGQPIDAVALTATGHAIEACRLGGIDQRLMLDVGVPHAETCSILHQAFDAVGGAVEAGLAQRLRAAADDAAIGGGTAPAFAEALIRQPRAGATCPGKPRLVLEPPENHGDHCFVVAALGCVLAPEFRADPATVFLAGMAHHLHNAVLPDSGFTGETLLGEHLTPVIERLFARELATLPNAVRAATERALIHIKDASTPEGKAFHTADVIDRVLQIRHFEDVARFRLSQALDEMDLVHAGPTQAFHYAVLRGAGLQ